MFATSMVPPDPALLQSVDREVRHQVRRLGHHPCLVLWSANNENEEALTWFPVTQEVGATVRVCYAGVCRERRLLER
jgi:beta-mannosidase